MREHAVLLGAPADPHADANLNVLLNELSVRCTRLLAQALPDAVYLLKIGHELFVLDLAPFFVRRTQNRRGMDRGRRMRRPCIPDELSALFRQAIRAAKDRGRGRGAQAHDNLRLDQINLGL